MTLEALMQAEKRTIGAKQTEKAVLRNMTELVFLAKDADERVTVNLAELCKEQNVQVVMVDSKADLGKACGIRVKAAAAAVLKS